MIPPKLGEPKSNLANLSQRQMIEDLYRWTFGDGRPGAEERLAKLEEAQLINATRHDVGCIDLDIKHRLSECWGRHDDRLARIEASFDTRFTRIQNMMAQSQRTINVHEVLKLVLLAAAVVALAL